MNTKKVLLCVLVLAVALMAMSVPAFADGNVAKINDTEYATLADALAAVPTDGTKTTITMIADEAIATTATGEVITIASGKNIVLDLNGHTISGTSTQKSNYFIANHGTLEIKDSTGNNGKITFQAVADTGYSVQNVTVYNENGTLTLTSGIIENTTNGGLSYAVNNSSNAWGHSVTSTFNMTGGILRGAKTDNTLRVYQNCAATSNIDSKNYVNISGGTIENGIFIDTFIYTTGHNLTNFTGDVIDTKIDISGGTVNGLVDMKIRHPFNTELNITDGDFTDAKLQVRKHGEYESKFAEPSEPMVNISGGDFAFGDPAKAFLMAYDNTASSWTSYDNAYSVSGGTFNVEVPDDYTADGFALVDNGNGIYGVQAAVAQVGSTTYPTLEEALAAAPSGATVTLLADIDYSTTYTERNARDSGHEHAVDLRNLTLDMNGHTISTINGTVEFGGDGATITNGTFDLVHRSTQGTYQAGTYALIIDNTPPLSYGTTGTVSVEDVTINGGLNVKGATVTVDEVTAETTASKYYAVWAETDATVTINSGTFTDAQTGGKGVIATGKNAEGGAVININGGTFNAGNKVVYSAEADSIKIAGGTFTKAVAEEYCAPDFNPVDNGNGTYGVAPVAAAVEIVEKDAYVDELGQGNLRFVTRLTYDAGETVEYFGTWFIPENLLNNTSKEKSVAEYTGSGINSGNYFTADLLDIPATELDRSIAGVSYVKLEGSDKVETDVTFASVNDYRNSTSYY